MDKSLKKYLYIYIYMYVYNYIYIYGIILLHIWNSTSYVNYTSIKKEKKPLHLNL